MADNSRQNMTHFVLIILSEWLIFMFFNFVAQDDRSSGNIQVVGGDNLEKLRGKVSAISLCLCSQFLLFALYYTE